ncbi:MAG: electron transport complex subunit RsxE [Candidatus Rokubacteria bacterium]|nr:electron transport complex subunit RsxE [Candidatus Rokubacteria bacterium]
MAGHGAGRPRRATTATEDMLRGVWRENPVLVQTLGLCPMLAVTNSVANAMVMSVATFFVLVCSSLLVAGVKGFIPREVRISSFILIIATFVTVADMSLEALVPDIHKALGAFVPLIVVNCIILGRQEAFASKHTVGRAGLDAIGMGAGFTVAMLMMGAVRELLGSGSFLGWNVFGPSFEPWVIMILPPGGFLTLAFIHLTLTWLHQRRARRTARAALGEVAEVAVAGRAV